MTVSANGGTNKDIVPGRCAFNQVKITLRMEFSGVLLEHYHFGSYLDHKGNTIDAQLELKNVEQTSQVLPEILNGMIIDLTGIQLSRNLP